MKEKSIAPHMTASEIQLYEKYLSNTRKYIEFGAGGSTVFACSFSNIMELHSVESDAAWLDILAKDAIVQKALGEKRLFLHHANIGPIKKYGNPKDIRLIHQWPYYFLGVWERLPSDADFILVDGRFRVACALFSLLMCEKPFVLGVHDYSHRPFYHVLEVYYDKVACEDSFAIFNPKLKIDTRAVLQEAYQYFFYHKILMMINL